jgi:hypothetical protein
MLGGRIRQAPLAVAGSVVGSHFGQVELQREATELQMGKCSTRVESLCKRGAPEFPCVAPSKSANLNSMPPASKRGSREYESTRLGLPHAANAPDYQSACGLHSHERKMDWW